MNPVNLKEALVLKCASKISEQPEKQEKLHEKIEKHQGCQKHLTGKCCGRHHTKNDSDSSTQNK